MNLKKAKSFILMACFIVAFMFTSCENEDGVINVPENTVQSASAKRSMDALATHFDPNGVLLQNQNPVGNIIFDFCFEFVYPVTLSYNNGTEVVVQDFNDLIAVLVNSSGDLYVSGIAFPFQVETFSDGAITIETINSEAEFIALLVDCGFGDDTDNPTNDCICTEEYSPVCVNVQDPNGQSFLMEFPNMCYAMCEGFTQDDVVDCDNSNPSNEDYDDCFDFVYPISIIDYDGNIIEVNSENEFDNVLYANYVFDFVYPLEIIMEENGQTTTMTIEDPGTLLDIIISCENDCICPAVVDPVCVEVNGVIVTYGNACEAECDGYTPNDFIDCNGDCACPDNVDPVCVEVNGQIVTYSNFCEAECDGYTQADLVDCDTNDCASTCPTEYDPVCVADPATGTTIEYPNACLAECDGYTPNDFVDCDNSGCNCTTEYDPVCVTTATGDVVEYSNACLAECDGYTPNDFVDCDQDCTCPAVYDPVCVQVNGQIVTYGNSCEAECDGYTQADFVDCDNDCNCPTNYDPVCVIIAGHPVPVEFANACLAECAGYTPNDFVDCDQQEECIIDALTVSVGDCDAADGTYSVTLNFVAPNFDGTFTVYALNQDVIGTFSTAALPITISGLPASPNLSGVFEVCLDNTTIACCEIIDWQVPDCNNSGCNCTTEYNPVCVTTANGDVVEYPNACLAECDGYTQNDFVDCTTTGDDCWEFVFPVTFADAGQTVTVTDADAFDAMFNPASSQLLYPFQVIINNQIVDILSPNYFHEIGEFENRCD